MPGSARGPGVLHIFIPPLQLHVRTGAHTGNGIECNTANLILNHGWWGHLFDGNEHNVSKGKRFYSESKEAWLFPPKFSHAWITAENINDVITTSGISGDIDLLSLDIDGMDYWVWKAIECIKPRVVVCETLNVIPSSESLTVPYDPDFSLKTADYHGASLAAMTKLADQKGYRLVGTHRYGFNAFFVLKGVGEELMPTVTPTECLADPYSQHRRSSAWPKIKDMNWVRV